MKELTIKEKAQKYDEAIIKAKVYKENTDKVGAKDISDLIEGIFPELKESEDEKIKKAILNYLTRMWGSSKDDVCGVHVEDAIEWLEKQGEKKPANKAEPKFKIGDTIIKKHNSDIHDFGSFTITDIAGGKYWYNDRIICNITEQDEWEIYEPVRQKPTWSEKDETALCDALWCCKQAASIAKDENDMGTSWYAETWLKSLKDRIKEE